MIAIYLNVVTQTLVVPILKSEEKTCVQIEHYGQKKLRIRQDIDISYTTVTAKQIALMCSYMVLCRAI